MASVVLPSPCKLPELLTALDAADAFRDGWEKLALTVPKGGFVGVAAMSFLCAWGRAQVRRGRRVELYGDEDTRRYLSRMDLNRHLGIEEIPMQRRSEEGRFLPLRLVESAEDAGAAVQAVADLFGHQFDGLALFLSSSCWAVMEILDNVLNHAATREAGAVCAQYFPKIERLDVAICDVGCGIRASLGASRPLWSHGHAVETALKRGVTRSQDVGQGNGLAGTREVAVQNGGSFQLWTGDVLFRVRDGRDDGFVNVPEVPGTGVKLSLDTRRPVDLSKTWMAQYAGTSYLVTSEPSLSSQRVVRVAAECGAAAGTREAARKLRGELEEALRERGARLALDFEGVAFASTSFFDELLGRLAKEMGRERFAERVSVQNLTRDQEAMANVALSQRLREGS